MKINKLSRFRPTIHFSPSPLASNIISIEHQTLAILRNMCGYSPSCPLRSTSLRSTKSQIDQPKAVALHGVDGPEARRLAALASAPLGLGADHAGATGSGSSGDAPARREGAGGEARQGCMEREAKHVRWQEHEIRAKALTVARLRSRSGRSGRSEPRATILGEGAC
jgi:hypothetical protein